MGLIQRLLGKPNYWTITELFKGDKRGASNWETYNWMNNFDFAKYCKKQAYAIEGNPQIKSAVTGIAGQTRGEGTYVVPAKRRDESGKQTVNDRSKKATQLIEQLNRRIDIDQLIFDTAFRMVGYGTCFWEKTDNPTYNVQNINPHHQPNLKPLYTKGTYNITQWTTNIDNPDKGVTYNQNQIVVLPWLPDVNWPYGTSFLTGIDSETKALNDLRVSAMEYARQNAYPFDVIQVGDSEFQPGDDTMTSFRNSIKNREAGGIQLTNAPVSGYTAGAGSKGVDFITDQMKFHRDQLSDGLIAPPLSKLYDSTEASAKVTRSWVREVLINPLQHILRTKVMKEVYTPYLIDRGYSVRNVPTLMFNTPETMMADEIASIAVLVNSQIMTPMQAADELGFEYDEAYWSKVKQDALNLERKKAEAKPKEDTERPETKEEQ